MLKDICDTHPTLIFIMWKLNQWSALFCLILFWCIIIYILLIIVLWFHFLCFVLIPWEGDGKGENDQCVIVILFLFVQCKWWKSIGTIHTFNKLVFQFITWCFIVKHKEWQHFHTIVGKSCNEVNQYHAWRIANNNNCGKSGKNWISTYEENEKQMKVTENVKIFNKHNFHGQNWCIWMVEWIMFGAKFVQP